MTKPTEDDLIPPDYERCQAEIPNGHTFMTLGGSPGRVRCKNPPTVLATERKAGADGLIGSMTLCDECSFKFVSMNGYSAASFEPIISK
jgi:hypothetical protein